MKRLMEEDRDGADKADGRQGRQVLGMGCGGTMRIGNKGGRGNGGGQRDGDGQGMRVYWGWSGRTSQEVELMPVHTGRHTP